jgi:hypothetical protein
MTEPALPDRFVARGRVRLVAGWQDVAGLDDRRGGARDTRRPETGVSSGKDKDKDGDATLPPLTKGQRLDGRFEPVAHQTRPPPRHTEATLLGAMESAGREIEDEELRAAMKDTGLGTPATRAATIETLVQRKFIARQGKLVVPTPTGIDLIERLPVPTLASPELTGAWESRLARIARGQDTRSAFMTDIVRYVGEVTAAIRAGGRASRPSGHDRTAAPPSAPPPPSAPAPGDVDDRQARLGMLAVAGRLFVRDLVRRRRQADHRRSASRSRREGKDAQRQVAAPGPGRGGRALGAGCERRSRRRRRDVSAGVSKPPAASVAILVS